MESTPPRRFERYVAIGDSSTEGLDDPDGASGYRGWANRLAERIATTQGSLLYANLGIRGRRTRQIRAEQLDRACALRPDLATVFSGTNDVVSRRFDAEAVAGDVEHLQRTLIATGATVLTFTLPDLTPVMPMARLIDDRVRALNVWLRAVSSQTGALLVDFAAVPVASDPRLWSDDRLHANAAGHERIAAALAHALGLPGTDGAWTAPLPPISPPTRRQRLAAELGWTRRHLLPWVWRHLHGRSSGDGLAPKRPELRAISASEILTTSSGALVPFIRPGPFEGSSSSHPLCSGWPLGPDSGTGRENPPSNGPFPAPQLGGGGQKVPPRICRGRSGRSRPVTDRHATVQ